MNHYLKRSVIALLALALILTLAGTAFAQDADSALVRFVHVVPDAPAVDVYTDGQLTITNLDYGQASGYVNLPAGEHRLTVTPTGETTLLWEQTIAPTAGAALTLVAAPGDQPSFLTYQDDLTPLPLGRARFAAIHAVVGAPAVDVALADGQVAVPNLEFGQPAGSLDLDTGFVYDFVVVPAGGTADDALLTPDPLALTTGTSYVLVVYGPADSPTALLLTAPTTADGDAGLVRLAHGVAGAPAVDVYLNDTLVAAGLEFGDVTEHVAVPAADYDLALNAAGTDEQVLAGSLSVEAGQAVTVAALGTPDEITPAILTDDISGLDSTQARISLINGIPGDSSVTATLGDTTVASELPFGDSAAADVAPTTSALALEINVDGSATMVDGVPQNFYGGVYYNVLVLAGDDGTPQIVVKPTAIAQGIASAPGAGEAVVAAPAETTPEAVAVEPTTAPTLAAPPAQPTAAPAASAFTARPLVDPGVNLQLRQYPNPDALSLGLAPSDATLIVNGRMGGEAALPGQPSDPNATPFVDPATLLEGNADLTPEDTWLNVTYQTPDGGSITAWVNAQFLSVSDAAGKPVRLASLPLIPMNQPGEAQNTGVTPPPVLVDRVAATVFNLDPGVNLNIRRVPSTDGEVLARVPNGTVMELLAVTEERDWAFVSYTPPEGGSITGWVNTLYVQYTLNGRPIDYEGMEARNLLVISDGTERGEVTAGVAPVARPTTDPLRDAIVATVVLDAGSNLNLRRNPNADSEVLLQIPSGGQAVVTGRSGDGNWLQVTFEGAEGWIAARTETATFVRLTLNGKPVDVKDVPIVTDEADTATRTVPTAAAQATLSGTTVPVVVTDVVVQMTGSPGGSADGLPILGQGQEAILLFTDGTFSHIQLPDGTTGWVPAGSVRPR
ncbi:MAG: DUF4397 domain-containing protein [Chloroflexi bacterium]|nr:DUF4397 domain-containing protein [Chloroflexota bacterium]